MNVDACYLVFIRTTDAMKTAFVDLDLSVVECSLRVSCQLFSTMSSWSNYNGAGGIMFSI